MEQLLSYPLALSLCVELTKTSLVQGVQIINLGVSRHIVAGVWMGRRITKRWKISRKHSSYTSGK